MVSSEEELMWAEILFVTFWIIELFIELFVINFSEWMKAISKTVSNQMLSMQLSNFYSTLAVQFWIKVIKVFEYTHAGHIMSKKLDRGSQKCNNNNSSYQGSISIIFWAFSSSSIFQWHFPQGKKKRKIEGIRKEEQDWSWMAPMLWPLRQTETISVVSKSINGQ